MKHSLEQCQNCFLLNRTLKLKDSTAIALLKVKSVHNVNPSGCVISQGCLPMSMYCVAEGKINTIERDMEGREHLVSSFTANHMFPLTVALSDAPTSYEYISEGRSKVCSFPVKTMRELLSDDPNLSLLLLQSALQRGMDSYERIVILQSKSAEEKITRTLEQFKDEDGMCRLSRKEISIWTNLTIETVIRTLTSLEKKRRVRKSPQGIEVMI
ncbi:Crp/Fnr family transcriptional regulator [Bdellovibrio sp. HCB209]|uniref:Crp/Fnr family transcriptional regulator n=1 Tax=Bdellovibrio sp. HCB209 TaxID=3394354 RepID=UPI0039B6C939